MILDFAFVNTASVARNKEMTSKGQNKSLHYDTD
jgi:hypothetical protein